jgi:hypothetical protein
MTDHPINPPPELVQKWLDSLFTEGGLGIDPHKLSTGLAVRAAQWGYEQHEKMLLDAMHSIVPQPYEPEAE